MSEQRAYHEECPDDLCDYYHMLVGPDEFECILTEPEDRVWFRDLSAAVDRLNKQHSQIAALTDENRRLRDGQAAGISRLQSRLNTVSDENTRLREALEWALGMLHCLVRTTEDGSAYVKGTNTEIAGFVLKYGETRAALAAEGEGEDGKIS